MTNPALPTSPEDDFTRLVNGYAELPAEPTASSAPATPPAAADAPATPGDTNDKEPSTPEERIAAKLALYEEYLKAEGYRYKVDEDGDISLRREGRSLVLFAGDDDAQHFRLSFPAFWECESAAETDLALDLVNQMNKGYKVVRFVLVDGWVWANVEMYLDPLSGFRSTFDRCADLLCETTAEFRRRIRRGMAQEPPSDPARVEQRELLCDDCAEDGVK